MNLKARATGLLALALSAGTVVPPCHATPASAARAQQYLTLAVQQMGGTPALQALKTVRFEAIGHREMVEQSERPEGPYVVEYDHHIVQARDLEHQGWRQTVTLNGGPFPDVTITTVSDGESARKAFDDHVRPGSIDDLQSAQETLELGPERILFTALAAPDLRAEADTVLQSVRHHVVAFTWRGQPVRLYLNSYTALPTEVEWRSAYPWNIFWSAWGDVTTRLYYSLWWLGPAGIHYPLQWDFFRNDLPDHFFTITRIATNVTFPADTFAVSADERAAYEKRRGSLDDRPLGIAGQPAVELAAGIVHIPGAWNVTLVRQEDGVVVLEAPISSGYSVKVLAEAARRWPGVPVKAVISTSDSWPHLAGVREYVARGIPVYALDLNVAILSRLVAAPRTRFPDALARAGKKPLFRVVAGKTLLGSGPNAMELYPLRGETSERQMMVYFPQHKLLYGSDAFQQNDQGFTFPQTVWEVAHAVEHEGLAVERFFMMHIGPTSWSEALQAIRSAQRLPAP